MHQTDADESANSNDPDMCLHCLSRISTCPITESQVFDFWAHKGAHVIIIIIIISISKEDSVFSMTANLPYGPPVNTDIDYYQSFFGLCFIFVSVAKLVVQYLLGEKPVLAL